MIRDVDGGCRVPQAAVAEPLREAADSRGPAEADGPSFRSILLGMKEAERRNDAWLERALGRGLADPQELLRLQVVVHRFQFQLELASKVVDQVSQGVRTLTRPG
jgi:hypothetical protein